MTRDEGAMNRRRTISQFVALIVLTLVVAGLCLFLGPVPNASWSIIIEVRLPRVILGLLVGSGLAAAGVVLQGILRNPLADPFILGTSSAATTGVMLAGILGIGSYFGLYFMALGFGIFSIYLVYRIATVANRTPVQTMILAGVIVSLFFNAVVFVFFSIFFREQISVLYYLLGTLTEGDSTKLVISTVIIVSGIVVSWFLGRDLDLLTQGEEAAFHLGVRTETSKRILFVLASAMVAASVAVAGLIGFIGLIVPHMMRIIMGPKHRVLIPASALGGALVLVLADAVARTAVPPLEIPGGSRNCLAGIPLFRVSVASPAN